MAACALGLLVASASMLASVSSRSSSVSSSRSIRALRSEEVPKRFHRSRATSCFSRSTAISDKSRAARSARIMASAAARSVTAQARRARTAKSILLSCCNALSSVNGAWTSALLRHPAVDTREEAAALGRRDRHGSVRHRWPQETAAVESLGVQARALAIVPDRLSPRQPRNTSRCPQWGSRFNVFWTIRPRLEKPLRMSVWPVASQTPVLNAARDGAGPQHQGHSTAKPEVPATAPG